MLTYPWFAIFEKFFPIRQNVVLIDALKLLLHLLELSKHFALGGQSQAARLVIARLEAIGHFRCKS